MIDIATPRTLIVALWGTPGTDRGVVHAQVRRCALATATGAEIALSAENATIRARQLRLRDAYPDEFRSEVAA